MSTLLTVLAVVYLVNVFPFFTPPTWTVLTVAAINYDLPLVQLAILGAIVALAGRLTLAKFSHQLIRTNILSEKTKENMKVLAQELHKNKQKTFWVFLGYTLSPLPTNYIFVTYGLAGAPLFHLASSFLIGRTVSYLALTSLASTLANAVGITELDLFKPSYLILEILSVLLVYFAIRVNWKTLFSQRKLGLIKE